MFKESNIILLLICLIPIVFYSIVIFFHSPPASIRFKIAFTYLYTGLLSVTVLQFIFFVFPHIHDTFFKVTIGSFASTEGVFEIYQQTLSSLLLYAFIQIAFMEEISKWIAFKCTGYIRGKKRKDKDHPYAIMFYSALISAGFSIVENIQYAQRAIFGEFGDLTAESVLTTRAVTSVIIHMACGLFMGYYIAMGRYETPIKKVLYNILGISSAIFIHGIYDFAWMVPNVQKDYHMFFNTFIHVPSTIIILFSIAIAFFMSWHLKHKENKGIKQQLYFH